MDSFTDPTANDIEQALEQANNLEKEFDQMNGYDQHDIEMDELAGLAIQAHKDLQELGMNVEVRHAGEIFSSSSQMLKIAVDAKNNKVEKKLKLLRLQLDKMKIDRQTAPENTTLDGTAVALDRNEILKQLRQMSGNDK
jgi:RNase P/RNase MRP subunit p29